MKRTPLFTLLSVLALAAAPASALEWTTMGAQAMGMGGAGVANVQGPLAAYWNPGALGRPSTNAYGLAIPVSAEIGVEGSVISGVKDLKNAKSNCDSGDPNCQAEAVAALHELDQNGAGLHVNVGAGGDLKIGKIDVFLNGFAAAGAGFHNVDFVNTTAGTIDNNTSSLLVKGARIYELGAGYGHELPWVDGLYVGGDFKIMRAEVGYTDYGIIANGGSTSNLFSAVKDNTATSGNIGVDLGALWDINKTFDSAFWSPRAGLVWRNINNPKFDWPATAAADGVGGKFSVNPQMRAGVSFSPLNFWHFAGDMDLTKNLSPLDGFSSQMVGAGTEIDVFNRSWINIPLRVGVKHNLAVANDGATYTLGTGVNLLHLIIDVSGEIGNQSIQVQNNNGGGGGSSTSTKTFPREAGASVQLSFLFGGSEEHRHVNSEKIPINEPAPSTSTSQPVNTDQIRANAEKAHQELNQQSAPPAIH